MSENRNNLVCISGVRGYEKDGVAYLHIGDVAIGLGSRKRRTMLSMSDGRLLKDT